MSGNAASTTYASISGLAGNKGARTGDAEGGIGQIFNKTEVREDVIAQAEIAKAFGQQASQAVGSYMANAKKELQERLKAATTEEDKAQLKAQLDEAVMQERAINILIGAVTGMGTTALSREALGAAAYEMRQMMIAESKQFAGVVDKDGKLLLSNMSGKSEGVDEDNKKVGGTRTDLDQLCGGDNRRCATNSDGSLALNDKRQVQFDAVKAGLSYEDFLKTPEGKSMSGPTGGIQG
jgi:filamentous hemagglutinin